MSFWSEGLSLGRDDILAAVSGSGSRFSDVVIPTGTADAVSEALGVDPGAAPRELDPGPFAAALADGALGLLPLPDVTLRFRALPLDGVSLFGNDRIQSLDDWPLNVTLELPAFSWDQARTWSLVAGGDVLPDRGVANEVWNKGKGVDYPWGGGTVAITGYHCCTPFGWPVTESERTGNRGAVRTLFSSADLSLVNLEGAVKDNFTYHDSGFIFTGDPRLLDGFVNAGIDYASIANNHIANGGVRGLFDTIEHLDQRGIAHAGAGENLEAAAEPTYLDAAGTRVAVISCSQVGGFVAREGKAGLLRCGSPATIAAITAARASADVVIVFPHWGAEYRATPRPGQSALAHAWAEAGVDLVLGSHSHWAAAVEEIDDSLVFYCLGNLIFDQDWSENTMEGLIVELTFQGGRLVQAWLHPTLILSEAQPNLLEFDAGGSAVLERVRQASVGLFDP